MLTPLLARRIATGGDQQAKHNRKNEQLENHKARQMALCAPITTDEIQRHDNGQSREKRDNNPQTHPTEKAANRELKGRTFSTARETIFDGTRIVGQKVYFNLAGFCLGCRRFPG